MERKIIMKYLLCICALTLGFFFCCTTSSCGGEKSSKAESKPKFDAEVGISEKDVIKKYGRPTKSSTSLAKKMKDELRGSLESKVGNGDVSVKELYYKLPKKEKIFWLVERKDGIWMVISNVEIPEGIVF